MGSIPLEYPPVDLDRYQDTIIRLYTFSDLYQDFCLYDLTIFFILYNCGMDCSYFFILCYCFILEPYIYILEPQTSLI